MMSTGSRRHHIAGTRRLALWDVDLGSGGERGDERRLTLRRVKQQHRIRRPHLTIDTQGPAALRWCGCGCCW